MTREYTCIFILLRASCALYSDVNIRMENVNFDVRNQCKVIGYHEQMGMSDLKDLVDMNN